MHESVRRKQVHAEFYAPEDVVFVLMCLAGGFVELFVVESKYVWMVRNPFGMLDDVFEIVFDTVLTEGAGADEGSAEVFEGFFVLKALRDVGYILYVFCKGLRYVEDCRDEVDFVTVSDIEPFGVAAAVDIVV